MDYKPKITRVEIDGLGEIHLRAMSARLRIRIAEIQASDESETAQGIRIAAEAVASCWVDEKGGRVMPSVDAVLDELDVEAFNAISNKIVEMIPGRAPGKNSGSAPNSSSPSTSQES